MRNPVHAPARLDPEAIRAAHHVVVVPHHLDVKRKRKGKRTSREVNGIGKSHQRLPGGTRTRRGRVVRLVGAIKRERKRKMARPVSGRGNSQVWVRVDGKMMVSGKRSEGDQGQSRDQITCRSPQLMSIDDGGPSRKRMLSRQGADASSGSLHW